MEGNSKNELSIEINITYILKIIKDNLIILIKGGFYVINEYEIVDLSVDFAEDPFSEPWPPKIEVADHYSSAVNRAKELSIEVTDFPNSQHLLTETIHTITHVGTHLDAPWHCGPNSEGKPAKKIGDIPLKWCIAPGVKLDLRYKSAGQFINVEDLESCLKQIDYELKEGDIVLLWTGADKYLGCENYTSAHPGMSEDAVLWLIEKGIKIIGVDSYGLDRPFKVMADDFKAGNKNALFPAHYACRKKEFCHIEKLCNLDKLPPYGFYIIALPIKIPNAGAAWTRVVALVNKD